MLDIWYTMTRDPHALTNLSTADYDAIELAVMETARGRWFLKEFAARNRHSDTNVLLEAMARLESAVSGERAMEQVERVRFDLIEMAKSIAGLKAELETQEHGEADNNRFGAATSALDGIVKTTEQATSSILSAAEQVQEIAWSLREQQFDEATCDTIDKLATDIYTACGFQDLTAQRTQKVVRTLRFLEGRINALIDAWAGKGDTASAGPAASPGTRNMGQPSDLLLADLSQSDVDIVIVDDPFADTGRHADDDIPPNVMSALSLAEAAADADEMSAQLSATLADAADVTEDAAPGDDIMDHDIMADDDEPIIIDDVESMEIDFIRIDEDVVEDKTAKVAGPPAKADPAMSSMARIDAMPTTAKAMIFG